MTRVVASDNITRVTADNTNVHVSLLAGTGRSGEPVFEVLPARMLAANLYELSGSPGLTLGCAAGDVIRLDSQGCFVMERRGPNLCIQTYKGAPFSAGEFVALSEAFDSIGGLVEAPADRRFIVVTIPVAVGLATVEVAVSAWAEQVKGAEWWFGNGDDLADQPT